MSAFIFSPFKSLFEGLILVFTDARSFGNENFVKARIINGSGKKQILNSSKLCCWELHCFGENIYLKKRGFFACREAAVGSGEMSDYLSCLYGYVRKIIETYTKIYFGKSSMTQTFESVAMYHGNTYKEGQILCLLYTSTYIYIYIST